VPNAPRMVIKSSRTRYRLRHLLLPLCLGAGSVVAGSTAGLAAEPAPSFGMEALHPPVGLSYFVYGGAPGTTLTGQVRVKNVGTATGDVAVYPVDATTGKTSGTVYLDQRAPRENVGRWTSLDAGRITLAPGEARVVSFRVKVPDGALPGQHVGGIVAENLTVQVGTPTPQQNGGALVTDIRRLVVVAVQVNVPGRMTSKVTVSGVGAGGTQGHQTLEIGLANTGNTIVKPQGVMDVANSSGRRLQHLTFAMDSVLPWTGIDYPVLVQREALGAGTYTADIKLVYGSGQVTRYHGTFEISQQDVDRAFQGAPPALTRPPAAASSHGQAIGLAAGLVAVVIIGLLIGNAAVRRRRRIDRRGPESSTGRVGGRKLPVPAP
jgi:hypothetical protein